MDMRYTILVILLLLVQYLYFQITAGRTRVKNEVAAPATTGNEHYERTYRVQANTLEHLIVVLPFMAVLAQFNDAGAAALGLVFFVGRALYSSAYKKNPSTRGWGMIVGMLAILVMLLWILVELALHIYMAT